MVPTKKQSRTGRFAAIEILSTIYRNRLPVKIVFERTLKRNNLPAKERNLAMQLVYGVLRRRQSLDRMIGILSKTPLKKIDPFVLQALAVGLYQLFYLERIPDSAAVNEVVESCKKAKIPKRLHGFVNGVLRQAIRQKQHLVDAALTDASGQPILNHPTWLIERWLENYGPEKTSSICKANSYEPTLVLRINSFCITRDKYCKILEEAGVVHKHGTYSNEAVALPGYHGSIGALPGYKEGFFQVQDEAAQLATLLLRSFRPGGHYLDACAGLGGKTTHLLQFGKTHDLKIHAVEPDRVRLKKLAENCDRLFQNDQPEVFSGTLQQFAATCSDLFDGILIDAPCSGTGVIGRHPDIRWNRQSKDLVAYQQEQGVLLEQASKMIVQGGVLVYATCSIEPEENQEVIEIFLARNRGFILTDCGPCLPEPARALIKDSHFAPLPSSEIDGFFATRIQRI